MKLVRHLSKSISFNKGTAVTIGNFDGVHLGHQALINKIKTQAKTLGLLSCVVVFEPQPREFFQGKHAPLRITTFREKLEHLKQSGIDLVVVLSFDAALADMSPKDFVYAVLYQLLNAKYICVGEDFRFGYQRTGDVGLLILEGKQHDLTVDVIADLEVEKNRISSSSIRDAILQSDFKQVKRLLARPYSLTGKVVYGNQLGRKLGFPTANLLLKRRSYPLEGIFAAYVHGLSAKPLPGAAYIGYRPAINGKTQILEVNILNFSDDIYGKRIEVELLDKIRDDKPLPSLDALKAQIAEDVSAIEAYFKNM